MESAGLLVEGKLEQRGHSGLSLIVDTVETLGLDKRTFRTVGGLPPTWAPCNDCGGERFSEAVLAVHLEHAGQRLSIADFFDLTVSQALTFFHSDHNLPAAKRRTALAILLARITPPSVICLLCSMPRPLAWR